MSGTDPGKVRALSALCDDLADEHAGVASVIDSSARRLGGIGALFDTATPAQDWTVGDQVSHLAGFDGAALWSLSDPTAFRLDVERRINESDDPIEEYRRRGRELAPVDLLSWFDSANVDLIAAARRSDPAVRVPWYGPDMSIMSFVTARVMEVWAHGCDVRDACGLGPVESPALRHVCHLGVQARPYSYAIRGMDLPEEPVDVVLNAPGGDVWTWGPGSAPNRVEGSALGFALVVTQRRHVDDTDLIAVGDAGGEWLGIAQAFAGAPGSGRRPGQFA